VLVMYSVTGFISYWITPKFKKIFDDFGTELPQATKWIIRASDTFADTWVLGVPMILLALGILTAMALLPVTGGLSGLRERFAGFWPRICLPDVLRALALATEAGVPMEEAFIPFVRRQLRVPLHNRLVRAQELVRDGGDCWIALENERLLRLPEAQFLRSAQRAGNLPWALETLSTRFEQRWQFWMLFCFEFVQPIVVLAVGLVVAFVAIAYFLPLVKLINDLA
jgi:general secretion pathway protein F